MGPTKSTTSAGAVAVTPHYLASDAAIDVMNRGGNAIDGAIAANAMLGTVLPTTCGIGGDLFALVHPPGSRQPFVLNASGRGGAGLDSGAVRAEGHTKMPRFSPWSITVPGCVDGWEALSDRFGTRPLGELLAPAIAAAESGFPCAPEMAASLARTADRLIDQPSAPALYPGGSPPQAGDAIRRPALASVLRGIAADGRSAFYDGDVAGEIIAATDGRLTADDLLANTPDWVEALGRPLFGLDAWTVPPNSQGYLTLAAAAILEELAWSSDPDDPRFHHAVIEAYRAVAWERDDLVADPRFAPLPPSQLVNSDRLAERTARLDADQVTSWPHPAPDHGGTAYFCVIDDDGLMVSFIQSNFTGIGSGISAGSTGVWLHNRGAGFSLVSDHPNEAAPGKRPLHTLAPTLWTKDGAPALLLGTRGGHQQPQYLLQAIAQLMVAGRSPEEAQAAPRWHMDLAEAESVVAVEVGMAEGVVAGLTARGHRVERPAGPRPGWGPISIIAIAPDGTRTAAADPRISTSKAAGG